MAEINDDDIISDGALRRPLLLGDNFRIAEKDLDAFITKLKNLNTAITASDTTSKVAAGVRELATAESELEKIQKKVATEQLKNNEAYIAEQKALAAVKAEIKEKIALGDRDALTVNKQNASLELLGASLKKNQAAYAKLNSDVERASTEGLKLKNIIDQQNKEFVELSNSIGKTNVNVGNYSGGIIDAYGKINKLNQANKELIALQGKLNPLIAEEKVYYNQLNVAIQNNLNEINTYNNAITNTKNKIASLAGQFLSAAGLIGGVFAVIQAFKSFIAVNTELEKSLSDLQALTGASAEDLVFYRDAAISIGAETKRSAGDVVEAFKLIGGARPELLSAKEALADVTKQAIILANASGLELADAASALTGVLNQLQLPVSDSARAINVLAAAAKEGAAEIPDLNESYKGFGAVLRGVNGSVEEGAALIEVLADRQIKGAEAGTALRNVLLNLSAVNALPKAARAQLAAFGVDLKIVSDNAVPLNIRLKELGKISGDATALVKVFGKENFVAGNIILNNIPRFEQLTKAVTGTNEAYRQAAVATDNLQGDTDEAKATVSALAAELGGHTQGALRAVVQSFTFLINVIRATPQFFRDNKALLIVLVGALLALNAQLIANTASTILFNAQQLITVARLKAARIATIEFFTTLAANPLGLFVIGLTAALAALAEYDKYSERAVTLNKLTASATKGLTEEIDRTAKAYDDLTISIDDYVNLTASQQQSINEQIEFQKRYSQAALERLKIQRISIATTAEELTGFQKLYVGLLAIASGGTGGAAAISKAYQVAAENSKEATKGVDEQIKQLEANIAKFDTFITDSEKASEHEREVAAGKEQDAAYKLQKFRIEQAIKGQKEILDNEKKGNDERRAANDRTVRLANALAKLERDHELASTKLSNSDIILANEKYQAQVTQNAKDGAKAREGLDKGLVEANRKYTEELLRGNIQANDNLLKQDEGSYEDRAKLIVENADSRQLLIDIQYQRELDSAKGNKDELLKIQEKYNQDSNKLAQDTGDSLAKDFFSVARRGYENLTEDEKRAQDAQVKNLNESLANKEISITQYASKRQAIEYDSNQTSLKDQISYLKGVLVAAEKQGLDVGDTAKKLHDLEIQLSDDTAEHEIENRKKVAEATQALAQEAFAASASIVANLTEKKTNAIDKELNQLKESTDKQIKLAGDNEHAKEIIQKQADAKEKVLQAEKNKALRKQAQYEKALALTQAGINVAQGVTSALAQEPYGFILAALVAAAGAIQIATIASKPLPAYAKGTSSAAGGLSLVGEQGYELMTLPSGRMSLTPSTATVMDIPHGTEIIPHDETVRRLAMMGMRGFNHVGSKEDAGLNREVVEGLKEVNRSIRNIKQPSLVREGAIIWEAKEEYNRQRKLIRGYNFGKWL